MGSMAPDQSMCCEQERPGPESKMKAWILVISSETEPAQEGNEGWGDEGNVWTRTAPQDLGPPTPVGAPLWLDKGVCAAL